MITLPFKEVSDYMLDRKHVTAPVQLKAVLCVLEFILSQEVSNDMIATGILIRKAVLEEGDLMFIPMGSIAAEKCLGKKARSASRCYMLVCTL